MRPRADFIKAYMHNGYLKSLAEVVHFYNTSQALPNCPQGSPGEKVTCWPAPETPANVSIERLIPLAKPPATRFRLPKGEGEPDMKQVLISLLKQTSTGQVSPQEAEFMARFVEGFLRAQAAIEHEGRLQSLEHYDSEERVV